MGTELGYASPQLWPHVVAKRGMPRSFYEFNEGPKSHKRHFQQHAPGLKSYREGEIFRSRTLVKHTLSGSVITRSTANRSFLKPDCFHVTPVACSLARWRQGGS